MGEYKRIEKSNLFISNKIITANIIKKDKNKKFDISKFKKSQKDSYQMD
jgi:hypothetical protein